MRPNHDQDMSRPNYGQEMQRSQIQFNADLVAIAKSEPIQLASLGYNVNQLIKDLGGRDPRSSFVLASDILAALAKQRPIARAGNRKPAKPKKAAKPKAKAAKSRSKK